MWITDFGGKFYNAEAARTLTVRTGIGKQIGAGIILEYADGTQAELFLTTPVNPRVQGKLDKMQAYIHGAIKVAMTKGENVDLGKLLADIPD